MPHDEGWLDAHNVQRGFWGMPTANTDWCEPNYMWSYYVAEWWNTLSSIPICTFALHGLGECRRYEMELKFYLAYFGVFTIGLGSIAFHGSLLRWGQILDEVPMLWASLCFLYVSMTMAGPRPALAVALILWGIVCTTVYFYSGFDYFVVTYGLTVAAVIINSFRTSYYSGVWPTLRAWTAAAGGVYAGGFLLLWLPEVLLCPSGSHVPVVEGGVPLLQHVHLHAWFHLTSSVGPYIFLVFNCYHRYHVLGRRPIFQWGQPHPALLLPLRVPRVQLNHELDHHTQ